MKTMTMMEEHDHHHGEKEHDHGFAADRVISEDEQGFVVETTLIISLERTWPQLKLPKIT